MKNSIDLGSIDTLSAEDATQLSAEELSILQGELAEEKAVCKRHEQLLGRAIDSKFAARAAAERYAAGKDTGVVHWDDGEMEITSDLPKDVYWDQDGLADAVQKLTAMGEPVGEYVVVKYSVMESKYKSWPSSLQQIFSAARTLGTGKPKYTIQKKESQ